MLIVMVTRTTLQVTEVEEQMKCLREEKSQVLGRLSEATKEKQALERKCSQVGHFCCNLLIMCIHMAHISDSVNAKCVCVCCVIFKGFHCVCVCCAIFKEGFPCACVCCAIFKEGFPCVIFKEGFPCVCVCCVVFKKGFPCVVWSLKRAFPVSVCAV